MVTQEEFEEQLKLKQQITQIEELAKRYLTKEALTRLSNIKAVDQQKALKIAALIAQLAQTGQLREPLTDEKLKQLLLQIQDTKTFTIKR